MSKITQFMSDIAGFEAQEVSLTPPFVAMKCPNTMHEKESLTSQREKQDAAEGT